MKKVWGIVLLLFCMHFVSSAHYIVGYANDALDGEMVDGKTVMLWNPVNGESDNLTDLIGVNGAANYAHVYMLDCEMLSSSCLVGDELRIRIIDNGNGYVSNYTTVIVTVSGYDMADNLTLNSLPVADVVFPKNNFTNQESVSIKCSFDDLDSHNGQLSLYSNFSGIWGFVESKSVLNGYSVFTRNIDEGNFEYSCYADDGLSGKFSPNYSLVVDRINPIINGFFLNESSFCGAKSVRVNCDTSDNYKISKVLIEISSPSGVNNYSMNNISLTNYIYDLIISESGNWNVSCYSEDVASNILKSDTESFNVYSGNPELSFIPEDIIFSNIFPAEGELINISVNVSNKGCVAANNFLTSFYLGGVSEFEIGNETISIPAFSSSVSTVFFSSLIGENNVFVKVDSSEIISENNESDNVVNKILNVLSWQEFYGNISAVKVLDSELEKFGSWDNDTNPVGNVFMTDSEARIDWSSLLAIGKDKTGENSSEDFSEIDSLLGMDDYIDSVSIRYNFCSFQNFFIHKENISNVPVVESTNNDNFYTGILWDSSDDTNGEFDLVDKEDLVFVSKINDNVEGKYGVYDYEIKIPAKLRGYDSTDTEDVYFYYELH